MFTSIGQKQFNLNQLINIQTLLHIYLLGGVLFRAEINHWDLGFNFPQTFRFRNTGVQYVSVENVSAELKVLETRRAVDEGGREGSKGTVFSHETAREKNCRSDEKMNDQGRAGSRLRLEEEEEEVS